MRPALEERFDCRFEVSFSIQRRATDTLAVDPENQPFRLEDGSLLFRPGGHGALIDNLNELGRDGWDIVLLKNIDNVVPDDAQAAGPPLEAAPRRLPAGGARAGASATSTAWRRWTACAARRAEAVLREAGRVPGEGALPPAAGGIRARRPAGAEALPDGARSTGRSASAAWCATRASRAAGRSGSSPRRAGSRRRSSRPRRSIPRTPEQQAALKASTHFNPVDIACGLRDRHGRPYDLHRYVDPATVFISEKSHEGRP